MAVAGTRNLLNQQLAVGIDDEIVSHPKTSVFLKDQAPWNYPDGLVGMIDHVDHHALIDVRHCVKYN